jgi:transcriptional regulator with XRE-family HTH domain
VNPVELVELLDERGVSTRELARRLEVSPMWVSRRTTGAVPISTEDELLIRETVERVTDYGRPS